MTSLRLVARRLSSSALRPRRQRPPPDLPPTAVPTGHLREVSGRRQHEGRLEEEVRAEAAALRPTTLSDDVHKLSSVAQAFLKAQKAELAEQYGEDVVAKMDFALANPRKPINYERREGKKHPLERQNVKVDAHVPLKPEPKSVATKAQNYAARRKRSLDERGFYVEAGAIRDNYVRGVVSEIPTLPRLAEASKLVLRLSDEPDLRAQRQVSTLRAASPAALEKVDPSISIPSARFGSERYPNWRHYVQYTEHGDSAIPSATPQNWWTSKYGQADPSLPLSEYKCKGCGAEFHSKLPNLPGFLPAQLFCDSSPSKFKDELCRRCHLLKHHNFLLNVNVAPVDYGKMMGHLKHIFEALIILVVDMSELPGSVVPALGSVVGAGKPLMVVGNKADLLPPDLRDSGDRYLARYRRALKDAAEAHNLHRDFNILYTGLLSAKTGFGVEDLVTEVLAQWSGRGDIYLAGCTNTGKSTLFNRLLQSDLCKVRSTDLLERATTSLWPGTTLNLLKFPVLNPAGWHLEQREQRLRHTLDAERLEFAHRKSLAAKTGDPRIALLQGHVGREMTSKTDEESQAPTASEDGYFLTPPSARELRPLDPTSHEAFRHSNWLHDTPGLLSPAGLLDTLTLEELVEVVPSEMLIPRSFAVSVGDWILLGGLGRVQFLDGPCTLVASVLASPRLPVHLLKGYQLDRFLKKFAGTAVLGVPKTRRLPTLEAKELELDVKSALPESAIGDVVLSSLGWVAFTPTHHGPSRPFRFRAWTPRASGIAVRQPALIPAAAELKGPREKHGPAYDVLPKEKFTQSE